MGNYLQNTCTSNRPLETPFKIGSEILLFSTSYYQLYLGSNGTNLEKWFRKTDGLHVMSGLLQNLLPSWIFRKLTKTNGNGS